MFHEPYVLFELTLTRCRVVSVLQIFEQLAAMTNEMTVEITITEYQQNVNELWDALMGFEMQLVEQLEVVSGV